MHGVSVVLGAWKNRLMALVGAARRDLLITSPYVGEEAARCVAESVAPGLRDRGSLTFVTNLAPLNVWEGATDPNAIRTLTQTVVRSTVYHLPRLHAKVYVADQDLAIVTSGNFTASGLVRNIECGIEVRDREMASTIRRQMLGIARLAHLVTGDALSTYCQAALELRAAFERQRRGAASKLRRQFQERVRELDDDLIRLRLAGGAVHTVFARTIEYLLHAHGSLATRALHRLIEAIHPDLCDNTVDRVIDGQRFGKKWKHAVRTAQQQLKKRGAVTLDGGLWRLTDVDAHR